MRRLCGCIFPTDPAVCMALAEANVPRCTYTEVGSRLLAQTLGEPLASGALSGGQRTLNN
jgi:hypothetical protein